MAELSDVLERFNRKERNLAVRHVLGCTDRPPPLCNRFCHDVSGKLGLDENQLADAWWATDYHISWLAGALAVYTRGDAAEKRTWPNEPVTPAEDQHPVKRYIAEGNQEDIDLLIVADNNLILIEVKAYGRWDKVQLQSKLTRLHLVKTFYDNELIREKDVRFHFLLLSPCCITQDKWEEIRPPDWVDPDAKSSWVKLLLPLQRGQILEVGRCDEKGKRQQATPSLWGIYKLNRKRLMPNG